MNLERTEATTDWFDHVLQLPAPQCDWPSVEEQREYWRKKELEPVQENGVNDWLDEEQQYSNYPDHEL